jgi:phosphopantetheine--protein transferase-like protein
VRRVVALPTTFAVCLASIDDHDGLTHTTACQLSSDAKMLAGSLLALSSLQTGATHVCRADVAKLRESASALRQHLSSDERARAARYRQAADVERFVITRGLLRLLLAGYLEMAAAQITFSYTEQGKPTLASPIRFNVSHAGQLVVLAFAWERSVGVDVEPHVDREALLDIARRFFTDEEHAHLAAQPVDGQVPAFYRLWTMKEAMLKAGGEGIGAIRSIDQSRYHVIELDVAPDYSAALALSR